MKSIIFKIRNLGRHISKEMMIDSATHSHMDRTILTYRTAINVRNHLKENNFNTEQ